MYVQVTGGVPAEITYAEVKAQNPNTSFPVIPTDELLANYNVYPVAEVAPPAYDSDYQTVTYTIQGSGSSWTQVWQVISDPAVTDEALRQLRYNQNYDYSQAWIAQAEATPVQGVSLTANQIRAQEARRNNRGRANDPTKVTDSEDYLIDWIDTVYDALDLADAAVENLDRAGLEAWNPATSHTWPTWVPYVGP